MSTLDVRGYSNNGGPGSRPRRPLVHILTFSSGEVQSICFHPDDAPMVAQAIRSAGLSAKKGRTVQKTIELREVV